VAVLRRLVSVALCAGLLAGIFAAAAHQIGTVPIILKAEVYEKPAGARARCRRLGAGERGRAHGLYTASRYIGGHRFCASACGRSHAARRGRHLAARAFLAPCRICDVYPRAGTRTTAGGARNRGRPATRASALVARYHRFNRMRSGAARIHSASAVGGLRRYSNRAAPPLWRSPVSRPRRRNTGASCSSIRCSRDGCEFFILAHPWRINRVFLQTLRAAYCLTSPPRMPAMAAGSGSPRRLNLCPVISP